MTISKQNIPENAVPIVPYLRLPDDPDGEAYLAGSRCLSCGETYLGVRAICVKCYSHEGMEDVALSRTAELYTFTVVHQSAPWVKVPYAAVVVKLPEGPILRATLVDCEPDPAFLKVGMPLEMVVEPLKENKLGQMVMAYKYKPAETA